MDFLPFIATFVACLVLGMELGILVGVVSDILLLLYYTARPNIIIEKIDLDRYNSYIKISPASSLLFPSGEYIRNKIMKYDIQFAKEEKTVVIDCSKVSKTDFTAAKVRILKQSREF